MNTSILATELAPLEAQIENYRQKQEALEGELRAVETELSAFSDDRERFDALRDVCNALDKLSELKAEELFWAGLQDVKDTSGYVEQLRGQIASFEEEISGFLERQRSIKEQLNKCLDDLSYLHEEVRNAYDREERRKEEFVIDREISAVPYRAMVMPWTKEAESEKQLRRAVLLALLLCFIFGGIIPLIKVPLPDRTSNVVKIPERLVKLVKKELPKPVAPEPVKKEAKEEKENEKKEPEKKEEKKKQEKTPTEKTPEKEPTKVVADAAKTSAARKKAESVGVLKFKDAFADLMSETPSAKVGSEARLSKGSPRARGQALASRSLVAMQAGDGSSGGIGGVGISRNVGNGNVNRLGNGSGGNGVGFERVQSNIENLKEAGRPTSGGLPPGRTDEEIQIVFDRYKATLYRIYNRELRKDPTLRGKILMRITIEPNGEVSMCKVESTDLASAELVAKIVARVKLFNFGPKKGVKKMTILYPIDFLPAG